jgi:hypothetical protein
VDRRAPPSRLPRSPVSAAALRAFARAAETLTGKGDVLVLDRPTLIVRRIIDMTLLATSGRLTITDGRGPARRLSQ